MFETQRLKVHSGRMQQILALRMAHLDKVEKCYMKYTHIALPPV